MQTTIILLLAESLLVNFGLSQVPFANTDTSAKYYSGTNLETIRSGDLDYRFNFQAVCDFQRHVVRQIILYVARAQADGTRNWQELYSCVKSPEPVGPLDPIFVSESTGRYAGEDIFTVNNATLRLGVRTCVELEVGRRYQLIVPGFPEQGFISFYCRAKVYESLTGRAFQWVNSPAIDLRIGEHGFTFAPLTYGSTLATTSPYDVNRFVNLGLYIGLGVAGLLLFISLICIICYCKRIKRRRKVRALRRKEDAEAEQVALQTQVAIIEQMQDAMARNSMMGGPSMGGFGMIGQPSMAGMGMGMMGQPSMGGMMMPDQQAMMAGQQGPMNEYMNLGGERNREGSLAKDGVYAQAGETDQKEYYESQQKYYGGTQLKNYVEAQPGNYDEYQQKNYDGNQLKNYVAQPGNYDEYQQKYYDGAQVKNYVGAQPGNYDEYQQKYYDGAQVQNYVAQPGNYDEYQQKNYEGNQLKNYVAQPGNYDEYQQKYYEGTQLKNYTGTQPGNYDEFQQKNYEGSQLKNYERKN